MPKPINPTEKEKKKEEILRAVATAHGTKHGHPPGQVLIGGTALRIAHELPRPSSDLDYAHLTDEEDRGENEVPEMLRSMNFKIVSQGPDAKIPIRTNIRVREPGWINLLKDNTLIMVDDIRSITIAPGEIIKRKGIWTTDIGKLLELKLDAIEDGTLTEDKRIKGRDLYDVAFMLEKHERVFTVRQIGHLDTILQQSVYGELQADWGNAFTNDPIMRRSSLIEIGDEILRGLAAFKEKFEQATGIEWNTENQNRTLDLTLSELRGTGLRHANIQVKTDETWTGEKTTTREYRKRD